MARWSSSSLVAALLAGALLGASPAFALPAVSDAAVDAVLDAYPDWRSPSKVRTVIPTADRQKATVKVRITFDKLDPRILPDMGVKVAFQGATARPTANRSVWVSGAAVRRRGGRDTVWVVHDGRLEERAVAIGVKNGDEVSIVPAVAGGA